MSEEYDFVEKSSPWTRPGMIAAAGFLALILVVGIVLTTIGVFDDDKTDRDATPAPTPTPTASSTPADPAASLCGLPGHETSGALGTAPRGTTWELAGSYAVPSSKSAGPGKIEASGLRYCYAHTKEGAVFAAANVLGWSAADVDPEALGEHVLAEGPGREAAVEAAKNEGDRPDSATRVQLRGFRLLSYSSDAAVVDLAAQADTGAYAHVSLELVWEDGDWRLRLTPDGSLPPVEPMPDLTGYVPWSGA